MSNRRHIIPVIDKMPSDISKDCSQCPIIMTAVGKIEASVASMKETFDKMYIVFNGTLEVQGLLGRMKSLE